MATGTRDRWGGDERSGDGAVPGLVYKAVDVRREAVCVALVGRVTRAVALSLAWDAAA